MTTIDPTALLLDIHYWDLPCVGEDSERRANAHGINLYPHVCAADEPHDVRRILDHLIGESA
jgi:hypothetical protein